MKSNDINFVLSHRNFDNIFVMNFVFPYPFSVPKIRQWNHVVLPINENCLAWHGVVYCKPVINFPFVTRYPIHRNGFPFVRYLAKRFALSTGTRMSFFIVLTPRLLTILYGIMVSCAWSTLQYCYLFIFSASFIHRSQPSGIRQLCLKPERVGEITFSREGTTITPFYFLARIIDRYNIIVETKIQSNL